MKIGVNLHDWELLYVSVFINRFALFLLIGELNLALHHSQTFLIASYLNSLGLGVGGGNYAYLGFINWPCCQDQNKFIGIKARSDRDWMYLLYLNLNQ